MNIKILGWGIVIGVIALVLIFAGFLIGITWPISEYTIEKTGQFGDSFGPLTSLFSGLAFSGIIITILLQREELKAQRDELALTREEIKGQKAEMSIQNETARLQRFENTFFNILETIKISLDSISLGSAHKGYDALKQPTSIRHRLNKSTGLINHIKLLSRIFLFLEENDTKGKKELYIDIVKMRISEHEVNIILEYIELYPDKDESIVLSKYITKQDKFNEVPPIE